METIVIFAAGKGTRMREITDSRPKSLIKIHGKPLLQYALESTLQHKFDRVIINTHYLSEQIEEFIDDFRESHPSFSEIILEYEETLLETGGTIKKLTKLYDLGEKVFTLNSDIIIDAIGNPFEDMNNMWNKGKMDMLLLLEATERACGYTGFGDFNLEADGRIHRHGEPPYPYMFTGMQIVNPQKIAQNSGDIFSFKEYYPQLGRLSDMLELRALPMQGDWYHANAPEDVLEIERRILRSIKL